MKTFALALTLTFLTFAPSSAQADGRVIAFGAEREQIRATPILERQNRPLHFYGNTVRRIHALQTGNTATGRR